MAGNTTNITIGKVSGNCNNANEMIFLNCDTGTSDSIQQRQIEVAPALNPIESSASFLSSTLPHCDSGQDSVRHTEHDLQLPTPVADSTSDGGAETTEREREQQEILHAPVTVEESSGYNLCSRRADCENQGAESSPIMMQELKEIDENTDDDAASHNGNPGAMDGEMITPGCSLDECTALKLVALNERQNSSTSLTTNGPDLPCASCVSFLPISKSDSCLSQNIQPQTLSRLANASTNQISRVNEDNVRCQRFLGEGERSAEETNILSAVLPDVQGTCIFLVHYKGLLLQNDQEPNIFVVDFNHNAEALENATQTGCFTDGLSELVNMKWMGHRDFIQSRWKLTLRPDFATSKLEELVKHVCDLFVDSEVGCIRNVMKQLNQTFAVFFHSMFWDAGPGVYLGHANEQKRAECLQSPAVEEVKALLLRLLPKWALGLLSWEETVAFDEEEREDGGLPAVSAINRSGSPEGISPIIGDYKTLRNQNLVHTENETLSQTTSFTLSNGIKYECLNGLSMSWSVEQVLKLQQQLQQQQHTLAELEESHRKEMSELMQAGDHAQRELLMLQQTMNQMQKECKDSQLHALAKLEESHRKEMSELKKAGDHVQHKLLKLQHSLEQQVFRLEMQFQEQNGEMAAVQEKLQQTMQENKILCEDWQQHQIKLVETEKVHQQMLEEMNKQRSDLQLLQQEFKQTETQQAAMMEIHKLRKEMEARFEAQQLSTFSDPKSKVVLEQDLGAVGGELPRNIFSEALTESEQTTSKMKEKDEEISANHEDRMRLPSLSEIAAANTGLVWDTLERGRNGTTPQGYSSCYIPSPGDVTIPERDTLSLDSSTSDAAHSGARCKQPKHNIQSSRRDGYRHRRASPPDSMPDTGMDNSHGETMALAAGEEREKDTENLAKAEQFLDGISIRFNLKGSKDIMKTIAKHVSAALKEEETPAPRAKCLDTILCLDVSQSIINEGLLDTVKKTAMDFIDGIEDLMDEMDLEENIAVVAVGGNARVVQHLTNDLTLVREAIESLDDRGGRSPFMQALLVCLAANKGRGGIVNVSGVHKVRPRIIFITDGLATDESQERGPDHQSNVNQTTFSLVQLLSQLASKKHRSSPRPINWVPVGRKADKVFLKSLAGLCGGELVDPSNIKSCCRYYKIQQTIGRLFKMVKNEGTDFLKDGKIKELLTVIGHNTITDEEKEHILQEVKRLQSAPVEEEEPEADEFSNVFEDEEKVKNGELLALGTRVIRGPDWKWKNQDTDGPGTVIRHSKTDNWIYVKWDNGTNNQYRYGQDGKCDIMETQHHPRQISPESTKLDFGVRVIRGPDWKGDNQDGKGLGTVIRCHESDGRVKVRWDKTSQICEYHYSAEKGKEVQIHMPDFSRTASCSGTEVTRGVQLDEDDKTIPMWKWRDEQRQWRLYKEELSDKLEIEYRKRPGASCVIYRAGKNRRVSFKLMQEKIVDGGATVEVMREMVDEERKNDLLAIELSLQDP